MLADLRLTLRTLSKTPAFVAVAVLTLTLGIGINSAMFGVVNALLLRGLPYPAQHELLRVFGQRSGEATRMNLSHLDLADIRESQRVFENVAAYTSRTFNLAGPGAEPERVYGTLISPSAVPLLRVPAALGRWFNPDDQKTGAPPVVVLSDKLWQNRFKADPGVLGEPLKVNGEWATIVGVAPPGFHFPEISELWVALRLRTDEPRDARGLIAFGRLKPHVSAKQAEAELAAIAARLATAHAATNKDLTFKTELLSRAFLDDESRQLLLIMFGAVAFVLLIACANVANLLLSRAAVRQKEIAVRAALGAGRMRLVRLLLMETLVLSCGGAVLGLMLAHGLMALLRHHMASQIVPYWIVFDIDATGVAYIVALAVVTCVVAGLWPAWLTSRTDVNSVLKEGGRGATSFTLSRFARALVIGEIVVSTVLLVLSGLTIRSVIRMQEVALGYRPEGVFTNRIALIGPGYDTTEKHHAFYRELLRRLGERSEIAHAAIATLQPTWFDRTQVEIEGKPRGGPHGSGLPPHYASRICVSENYFETLGIRLVQGRAFDERDGPDAPRVAVVSTKFAERHWPRESPLGKRFVYGLGLNVKPHEWLTVIGVVAPVLQGGFQRENVEVPQTYVSFAQERAADFMVVFSRARNAAAAAGLARVVRDCARQVDPEIPIYRAKTLETEVAEARFFKQLVAWMFGIFGFVALLLATVGLYGVMSYAVSQRTQEIGVRMALGAAPGAVLGMILREGGRRLAFGLTGGLVIAFFAGRLVASALFGVEPRDGVVFLATLVTLGAAGLVACIVPALRAVRVNPVDALRGD